MGMIIDPYRFAVAGAWYTVWTMGVTGTNAGNEGYTMRTRATTLIESGSFTKVRVTFKAGTGGSFGIENASIGIYAGSNTNTTATPTQLLFSGGATKTITAGATGVSDELTFSFSGTDGLVVIADVDGTNGNISLLTSGGQGAYNAAATNSYNNATGGLSNAAHAYCVSLIEGWK